MRISDWSSDVCSSDLGREELVQLRDRVRALVDGAEDQRRIGRGLDAGQLLEQHGQALGPHVHAHAHRGVVVRLRQRGAVVARSEEHTSKLQSLMRISYAVFCLKKKTNTQTT